MLKMLKNKDKKCNYISFYKIKIKYCNISNEKCLQNIKLSVSKSKLVIKYSFTYKFL